MKTRLLIFLVLIMSNTGFISHAYASQCISGISLEDNYKNYDYVFSGMVESIDYANPIKVQFYIHQSWKGNVTDPMIVNTAFSSDPVLGFQFEEGKHYLVFASNDFWVDHPTVRGCSPTKLLSESKDDVLQLQQLTNFTHPLRACTSDRSACFQNELICDPKRWDCGTSEGIFTTVEEPEPTEEQFSEEDRKRYCEYAVERHLPTPWKYRCYDDPLGNPQRDMDLGNPILNNVLLNCNDKDNTHVCFKNALDSCTPAKIEQGMSTIEGDPVYTSAYITDNCKIHVIFDNREDQWISLADRKITESNCSAIQFKENKMIISNCNDWNSFEFHDRNLFCHTGTIPVDGVCVVVSVERGILMHGVLGPLLLVVLVGILVSPIYAILKFKKPVNKTLFIVSISIASIIFSSVIYGEFLLVDDRTVAPSPTESFFFTLSILGSFFITISFVVLGVVYWRKNEQPNKMMLFIFFVIATIPIILLMTGVLPRGANA